MGIGLSGNLLDHVSGVRSCSYRPDLNRGIVLSLALRDIDTLGEGVQVVLSGLLGQPLRGDESSP